MKCWLISLMTITISISFVDYLVTISINLILYYFGHVIASWIPLLTRASMETMYTRARKIQGRHKVGRKGERGENRRRGRDD